MKEEEYDDNIAEESEDYREVQLDFTQEMGIFYMLYERCHTKDRKRCIKQHI